MRLKEGGLGMIDLEAKLGSFLVGWWCRYQKAKDWEPWKSTFGEKADKLKKQFLI